MRKHYCVYVDRFDQCEKLTDQELGRLHRALMHAYSTGEMQELAGRESIAYVDMYKDVTQDAQSQQKKSETYRENIRKRWYNGIQSNTTVYNGIQSNTIVSEPLVSRDSQASDPTCSTIYINNTPYTSSPGNPKDTISTEVTKETKRGGNKGVVGGEEGEVSREACEYLNLRAGTHYKASTPATQKHIRARLAEGYTLDDIKSVIDKKCAEWMGTEWQKFLRPETLFGSKFESYLNAPARPGKKKSGNVFLQMLREEENAVEVDPEGGTGL